uniref:TonB-dependent receptor n=1 Tax=Eiseniibacteriota bacterium TaxID=2212470 RepID=A0A832MKT1_UNCEI
MRHTAPTLCAVAFTTCATLAAGAARAAAPAPPAARDTSVYESAPVTVIAPRPRATPGGSSAVSAALDTGATRPAPTLEQVLREMPLVVIRANSRGEAQPALRGAEDRQMAVLVDGVPVTLAWDHRADLSVVSLTAARNVTLHRGLSSLLMGPNALGGAVEVDVARGERADAPPPPLAASLGVDHSGARSASLAVGAVRAEGGARWVLRAGAGHRGSDGAVLPRALAAADPATRERLTADGERRRNTDLEAFDAFVSARRTTSGGAWAAFTGTGYRIARGVAPEAHTAAPRLWRYPYQARGLVALSGGTGMRDTPWGRGDLEANLGLDAGRTEIDAFDGLDYAVVSGGERADDRTFTARVLGDHTLGSRGDVRAAATIADVSHRESLDGGPRARYRQRLWSLAAESDWRVPAARPLRVSAGVAADGADTPDSGDKPALGRLWDWGARAGATAVLGDGRLLAHAAASRRARFPALRELYSGALGRFLENPALRAEVEWMNEAGVTARHARGEVQIVAFHSVLEDGIARVAVATPSGNRFQRVNRGRVTGDGLEVLARASAGALVAGGDLTLQRLRALGADGAAAPLEYEPAAHGRLWCEARLPRGARLGLEARGTGRQRFIDLDRGAWGELAPGVRFDARLVHGRDLAGAGPFRRADIALEVENVADAVLYDQAGLPAPGRTVRLHARLR